MFSNSSKITVIVSLGVLMSGMLLANDPINPQRLGRECAQLTMKGLVQLIKHNTSLFRDSEDKGILNTQRKVMSCIEKAVSLKSLDQRKLFLEAGIQALQEMNFVLSDTMIDTPLPGDVYFVHLEPGDKAYAGLAKYFGIIVFKKALDSLHAMPWGQGRGSRNRALFSGLPFTSKHETYRAFARAATLAYRDAYNIVESEDAVAANLECYFESENEIRWLGASLLALELIEGQFGDRVAAFVCAAHLFAPMN